jgi:hypothetical protein
VNFSLKLLSAFVISLTISVGATHSGVISNRSIAIIEMQNSDFFSAAAIEAFTDSGYTENA